MPILSAEQIVRIKYGLPYLAAERLERKYYREKIFTLPIGDDEIQLDIVLNYKTRTKKYAIFEALSIVGENQGYWKENVSFFVPFYIPLAIEVGTNQAIIVLVSSQEDDIGDECGIKHFLEVDDLTPGYISTKMNDEHWLSEFLVDQPPIVINEDTGKTARPIDIYRASRRSSNFYSRQIMELSEVAHSLYVDKRKKVSDIWATDMLMQVYLKRKDYESVRGMVGNDFYDFLSSEYRREGKQATIGGAMAAMNNEISWSDKRRHDKEDVSDALSTGFYEESLLFQIGDDDMGRFDEDRKSGAPNIISSYILQSHDSLDKETVTDAFKKDPKIFTNILSPLIEGSEELGIEGIVNALKRLKELNLKNVFQDACLAAQMGIDKTASSGESLEEKYGVKFDDGWKRTYEQLIEKL